MKTLNAIIVILFGLLSLGTNAAENNEPKVYTVILHTSATREEADAKSKDLAGKLQMKLPQVKVKVCNMNKEYLFVQSSVVFAKLAPGKFVVTSDCFSDKKEAQEFLAKVKSKVKGASLQSVKIRKVPAAG